MMEEIYSTMLYLSLHSWVPAALSVRPDGTFGHFFTVYATFSPPPHVNEACH